jgi:phage N-6-adenine-methyltransferase
LITAAKAQWAKIKTEEKYLTASYFDFAGTLEHIKVLCGEDTKAWTAAYKQIGIDRRRVSEILLYRKVFKSREEAGKCSVPRANKLIRLAGRRVDEPEGYDPYQDCFETPQWLYDVLDAEFGFGLDAAATGECHKCEVYLTPEQDALKQDWKAASRGKAVFLNSPFHRDMLPAFVEKAYSESQRGLEVACIPPFFKSYQWFRDYVWAFGEMRQIQGPVVFDGFGPKAKKHAGNIAGPQSFDTVVAIFRPNQKGFSGPYIDRPQSRSVNPIEPGFLEGSQEAFPSVNQYPLKNQKSKKTLVAGGRTEKSDDHYTPKYALDILLPYLPKDRIIWEAAWGSGMLAGHLTAAGHEVVGNAQMDFLQQTPAEFHLIVTNPPFSFKDEFLERAYSLGKPFAFLLPLEALTGGKRCPLYMQHGIQVLVPSKRINFINNGQPANHANFPTAWFCWKLLPDKLIHVEATW